MYWQLEVTKKKNSPLGALRTCLIWLFFNLFFVLAVHFRIAPCLAFQSFCKNNIHHVLNTSSHYVTSFLHAIKHLASIINQHEELTTLRAENARLNEKLQTLNNLAAENMALNALLAKTKRGSPYQALSKVILSSSHPYLRSLLIEAQGQNFAQGQTVVADEGLIGHISHIQDDFATVTLISDMRSHIPVRVGMTARGILTGSTDGQIVVTMIDQPYAVADDMPVYTLSDGKNMPSDIYVGTVESVSEDTATILPAAQERPMFVMVLPKIRE